jgi:HEAT repeat protein
VIDSPTHTLAEKAQAIEAIGRLAPTKEGAEVLARLITHPKLRGNALQALGAMGTVAEVPVAQNLKDSDENVRIVSCILLANIGGQKSATALENHLRTERDEKGRLAAEASLKHLRHRLATEKEQVGTDKK